MKPEVIYTQTASFDKARALTDAELRKIAPSIFAKEAHESRSEKFIPIPTIDILRALAKEGFHAVGAKQSVSRSEDRRPFTKHLIRLRRLDGKQPAVGDSVFEMLLKNANDGSARYNLLGGMWRVRCMNSLVTHSSTVEEISVRHTGDAVHDVIEGTYKVLEASERVLGMAERWGRIPLKEIEREAFAKRAHKIKFGDKTGSSADAIKPTMLLAHRRDGDKGHDLWTTLNVVQENIMKGGLEGQGRDSNGNLRAYTTRPVNGIDADVSINRALWELAEQTAIRRGAPVPA